MSVCGHATAGLAGASTADRVAVLVAGWARRAVADGTVAIHPHTLVGSLAARVTGLAEVLQDACAPLGQAGRGVGEWLVTAHLTGPTLLSTLLTELQAGLLAAARVPDNRGNRARLAALCGQITGGYVAALRDQLLDEQELLKTAALTAQRSAEASRRHSEARLAALFANTGIGIGIGDLDSSIVAANPALCRIVGRSAAQLRGHRMLDLVRPADQARLVDHFLRLLRGEVAAFTDEFRVLCPDGALVWTNMTVSLMYPGAGQPPQVIATVEDVSGLASLRGEFHRQNSRDGLTGLANRTRLWRRIQELTDLAERGEQLALCFFDIDGFKVINDGLGREVGDMLLRTMGTVLRSVFDSRSTLVARIGADAFAALVSPPASVGAILDRITRVQRVLGEPVYLREAHGIAVSVSIGVVVHEAAAIGPEELVRAAEITLHRAKAAGKAQWMVYEPGLDDLDRRRCRLGAALPGAIEIGAFEPLFSPVRLLADDTLTGYHAGLRWRHAEYGLLCDADFGDLADQIGLARALSTWLIRKLCACLDGWRAPGDDTPALAFALTPRAAADPELVTVLRTALDEYALPARLLFPCFPAEVLADPDGVAVASVRTLAGLGMHITIDGFGEGANLLRLSHVPAEVVRLTPQASRWCADPANVAGVGAFVALAHRLGLLVTATDAHTPAELAGLRAAGVDAGCGQALGAPRTAAELTAVLCGDGG